MKIYGEESFGQVKPIIRVNGDEEAIRIANDTEYGLSAAVLSQDIKRVARKIETGIRHINRPTVADEAQIPFGGTKASGYGRFGGKAVIDEFTELRWITSEGPQSVLNCHIEGIERWIVKEPTCRHLGHSTDASVAEE